MKATFYMANPMVTARSLFLTESIRVVNSMDSSKKVRKKAREHIGAQMVLSMSDHRRITSTMVQESISTLVDGRLEGYTKKAILLSAKDVSVMVMCA